MAFRHRSCRHGRSPAEREAAIRAPWNLFRKSAQQMLQQERNKGREKMDTIYSELYISTYK